MIITTLVTTLYAKYTHLLTDWDHPWTGEDSFQEFSDAIRAKGAPLSNCVGFIDGTLRQLCRPGKDQRECYSGHKRMHGLKFQSIVLPNGIIGNLNGPYPGRRHDCFMLTQSGVLPELQRVMPNYCLYGDPAYPLKPQLLSPFKGSRLTPQQREFNMRMSAVRQAVEWEFGKVVKLFAFLDFSKNLKLYLQPVGKLYFVGVMLCNCHTCLYGSQTSNYFRLINLQPPSLEEYLY